MQFSLSKSNVGLRAPKWVHSLFLFPFCFREKVNVTCKIVLFLCSLNIEPLHEKVYGLDNFVRKNAIVFFFGNQISKWGLKWQFVKRGYFLPTFHIFYSPEKRQKIPSAHIPLTYTYFTHPIDFCPPNFAKIANLSCMVSLWCESWCWFISTPFWSNQ